jgi:hypothetical protein
LGNLPQLSEGRLRSLGFWLLGFMADYFSKCGIGNGMRKSEGGYFFIGDYCRYADFRRLDGKSGSPFQLRSFFGLLLVAATWRVLQLPTFLSLFNYSPNVTYPQGKRRFSLIRE